MKVSIVMGRIKNAIRQKKVDFTQEEAIELKKLIDAKTEKAPISMTAEEWIDQLDSPHSNVEHLQNYNKP